MTEDQFQQLVGQDAHLAAALKRAGQKLQPAQFGFTMEAATVVLLFPLVHFILTTIGLPWLHELRRYSELHRQRAHEWISENYRRYGLDPDGADAATNALMDELQRTSDSQTRGSWEKLLALMKESASEKERD
jgi:hypothetical protein